LDDERKLPAGQMITATYTFVFRNWREEADRWRLVETLRYCRPLEHVGGF